MTTSVQSPQAAPGQEPSASPFPPAAAYPSVPLPSFLPTFPLTPPQLGANPLAAQSGAQVAHPGPVPQPQGVDRSVAARWTPRLAAHYFTPVSEVFLHNLHRLRPHDGARGLNPTETLVIIQIMSHKWDGRAPFPALTTIAERIGLDVRSVRASVKRLEGLGYLRREPSPYGGPNRYHLDGLFQALERLLDEDAKLAAAAPTTAEAA